MTEGNLQDIRSFTVQIRKDDSETYVFNWDEIPGKDNGRLIESLNQKFHIDWVKTAKIEKIDNGKTIQVSNEKRSLSLRLNNENKVNLKIDDGRADVFIVKTENGKLNIYCPVIVGTAFVVSRKKGLLITCKHVVELASPDPFQIGVRIWVYFPQVPDGQDKIFPARVTHHFSGFDDDVVALELEKPPTPSQVNSAILGNAQYSVDHKFKSFGYRRLDNYQGLPARGIIMEFCDKPQDSVLCGKPLPLSSQHIDSGMSGSAVLDCKRNLVVGVVTQTWDSGSQLKDRDTSFAVDCDVFRIAPFNLPVRDEPCPPTPTPELKTDTTCAYAIPKLSPAWNNAPASIDEWVGREDLLQAIDNSWAKAGSHIIGLIGFGGEGKSCLAHRWLDNVLKNKSKTPDGVFWWSFKQPVIDDFFDAALRYVTGGFIDPRLVPSVEKKIETIGYSFEKRFLFILDGLEILQKQDGDNYGGFISDNFKNFLFNFTKQGSNSSCLITSRVPIIDFFNNTAYAEHDVGRLNAADGRALLRKLGVKGDDFALDRVVAEWDGHALALTLLAGLLVEHCNGDAAYPNKIPLPASGESGYQRITHILEQYDSHMSDAERVFLMIFSAFRRSVEKAAFKEVFWNKKDTDSLNAAIASLSDTDFEALVKRLMNRHILRVDQCTGNYTIHPLIRSHYYKQLNHSPDLTKLAHKRIKKYYLGFSRNIPNPTIDDLTPLIEAVHYSCKAGEYEDGYKIYLDKIDQKQGVLLYQLGAYETDLALMLEFFPEGNISQEPLINDPQDKAYLIRSLGLCLMTVGHLQQALTMYEHSYEISFGAEDLFNAGKARQLLSELHIHLGNLTTSKNYADQAIGHYQNTKDCWGECCSLDYEMWGVQNAAMGTPQLTICCLGYKAWTMHLSGDKQGAGAMFKQAEESARRNNPKMRYLRDLWGIYHADHLLQTGDTEYAKQITDENLKYARDKHVTEIISQCHRVLGDIDAKSGLQSAREHYDEALKIARNITHRAVLIEALLGRGRWNSRHGDIKDALSDLEEALNYASTAGYRIYEADIRMALAGALGNTSEACLTEAVRAYQLSNDTGYYWVKEAAQNLLMNFQRRS